MSFREEQMGKFFMGGANQGKSSLILPEDALKAEFRKAKEEKEAQEMAETLTKLAEEKQKDLEERLEKLEILPMFNKIILMPYPTNPYKKLKEGNIWVDYDGSFQNPDSGEKDTLNQLVGCAKVIEVGPECKFLKPGDDIYYDTRTVYPVPFMSMGYQLTSEPQILCVLNESLKERFKMN